LPPLPLLTLKVATLLFLITNFMPKKSIISADVAPPFHMIFLLVAFSPIGHKICDGVSLFETSIDTSRLNDNE